MGHLDADYIRRLMERLASIPDDASPAWGAMDRQACIEHLIWTVKAVMGKARAVPFGGNWLTTRVLAPLVLRGWVPIPKNVKLPNAVREMGIEMRVPGDLETLHAALEEYIALVQADELTPAPHPVFGDIGVDGWDRMHVLHFEHHCKQFGV